MRRLQRRREELFGVVGFDWRRESYSQGDHLSCWLSALACKSFRSTLFYSIDNHKLPSLGRELQVFA